MQEKAGWVTLWHKSSWNCCCVACMVATEADKIGRGSSAVLSLKQQCDDCLQGKGQALHQ